MPTDLEVAKAWRTIADYNDERNHPNLAALHRNRADELDPPAPAYPDGTVAWVTRTDHLRRYIAVRHDNAWRITDNNGQAGGIVVCHDDMVAVVEPVAQGGDR